MAVEDGFREPAASWEPLLTGLRQRFQVAGIDELVDVDDAVGGMADNIMNHGRADIARGVGDKKFHGMSATRVEVSCSKGGL